MRLFSLLLLTIVFVSSSCLLPLYAQEPIWPPQPPSELPDDDEVYNPIWDSPHWQCSQAGAEVIPYNPYDAPGSERNKCWLVRWGELILSKAQTHQVYLPLVEWITTRMELLELGMSMVEATERFAPIPVPDVPPEEVEGDLWGTYAPPLNPAKWDKWLPMMKPRCDETCRQAVDEALTRLLEHSGNLNNPKYQEWIEDDLDLLSTQGVIYHPLLWEHRHQTFPGWRQLVPGQRFPIEAITGMAPCEYGAITVGWNVGVPTFLPFGTRYLVILPYVRFIRDTCGPWTRYDETSSAHHVIGDFPNTYSPQRALERILERILQGSPSCNPLEVLLHVLPFGALADEVYSKVHTWDDMYRLLNEEGFVKRASLRLVCDVGMILSFGTGWVARVGLVFDGIAIVLKTDKLVHEPTCANAIDLSLQVLGAGAAIYSGVLRSRIDRFTAEDFPASQLAPPINADGCMNVVQWSVWAQREANKTLYHMLRRVDPRVLLNKLVWERRRYQSMIEHARDIPTELASTAHWGSPRPSTHAYDFSWSDTVPGLRRYSDYAKDMIRHHPDTVFRDGVHTLSIEVSEGARAVWRWDTRVPAHAPTSLSILHPPQVESLMNEFIGRVRNLMTSERTLREIRTEALELVWLYYHTMPYHRGTSSIGRIFGSAFCTVANKGKKVTLPDSIDVAALSMTKREFVGWYKDIFR